MKSRSKKSKNLAKSKIIKKTGLQIEEKYLAILKELPDIVYKIDPNGHFTFINNAVCILGYKPDELIGKHFSKIVHPDDVKLFSRHFVLPRYKGKTTGDEKAPKLFDERRTGKRKTANLEIRLVPKKEGRSKKITEPIIGEVIAFGDVSAAGHYDVCVRKKGKKFLGTLGIIRNVTKAKQTEKKLHYQADLLQNVTDAIISTDMDFKIRTWNKAAEKMYGWKAHEVIDKPMNKVTKVEYPGGETVKNIYKKLSKKGYWIGVVTEKRKDGKAIIISKSMAQIVDASGNIIGAVTVNRDITDIRHALQKLRESEEKYRHIVESAPDGIITVDRKGIITSINASFCKRTSYSKEDIIGKHISKMPTARLEDIPKYIKIFSALLRGKVPKSFEFRWIHKDKSVHWGEVHVSQMKTDGKIVGYQAITRDITERKANEEARRLSDEKLSLAVEAAGLGLWDQNFKTHTVYRNEQWAKMLGYTAKETEAHPKAWLELIHPDDKSTVKKMIRKHEKGSVPVFDVEHRLRTKDGQWRWIRNWGKIIERDKKGKPLRALGVHLDITERKRADEAIRKERDRTINILDSMKDGIYIVDEHYDIEYVNPVLKQEFGSYAGKKCYTYFTDRKKVCPWCKNKDVFKGKTVRWEWFSSKNKKTYDLIDTPLKNIDGSISKLEIFRDITDRKKAEEELRASLTEKEALIKEVHHRVKNNLQIISSLLNLQAAHIHDEYYKNLFRESQNRIKSMVLVHEKLYQSKDLTAINVRDYINGLLKYLCHSYGIESNRIAIKTDIEDITMNIDIAIPCGLIITELVSNSLTHAFVEPHRGSHAKITVKIHLDRKDKAVLIVSDNGIGFPDGLDFKKTESLGMQLVCALTEQLSGNIKLARGKGTAFTITFKKGS